ncbi:MAG: PAS domain-containing protein, partial [Okeania sp. SIO2D1]|nr:PAS domain-containing protein [Okeania sp. SIO2D1]
MPIVVILPEASLMQPLNPHTQTAILWFIAFSIIITEIGVMIFRWFNKSSSGSNSTSKVTTQTEESEALEVEIADEIGRLAEPVKQETAESQESVVALQKSDSRLTQFLEALQVGVMVYNTSRRPTYANQMARQITGINTLTNPQTGAFVEDCQFYISGTDQRYPLEKLPMMRALSGESCKVDDIAVNRLDRLVPLEVWATPVCDEQGNVTYAIVALTDITERRQAQKNLVEDNRSLENQITQRLSALRESALRERVIAHVLQKMHRTLDLDTIFKTTTSELQQVLNCDRVAIYRFNPDWSGKFVAEASSLPLLPQ